MRSFPAIALFLCTLILGFITIMMVAKACSTGEVKLEWYGDSWTWDTDDSASTLTTTRWLWNAIISMTIVSIGIWIYSGIFNREEVQGFSRVECWIAFLIGWFFGGIYLVHNHIKVTADRSNPPSLHQYGMGYIGSVLILFSGVVVFVALIIMGFSSLSSLAADSRTAFYKKHMPVIKINHDERTSLPDERVLRGKSLEMHQPKSMPAYEHKSQASMVYREKQEASLPDERVLRQKSPEMHQPKSMLAYEIGPKPGIVLAGTKETCLICRKEIETTDDLAQCPKCKASFHEDHLAEWVKVKGNCPKCKRLLQLR